MNSQNPVNAAGESGSDEYFKHSRRFTNVESGNTTTITTAILSTINAYQRTEALKAAIRTGSVYRYRRRKHYSF